MMKKNTVILIADAHITENSEDEKQFFEMLSSVEKSNCDIIFMGDIFELWIGFDAYESAMHRKFLQWAASQKTKRTVGFIEGNHEFYIREAHGNDFSWVTDYTHYLAGGKVCLMHGDTINEADWGYILFRAMIRNPLSRWLVRLFGPLCGRFLSDKIRLSLKHRNMKHKKFFPEKYICTLNRDLSQNGKKTELCVTGHFHAMSIMHGVHVIPAWCADSGEIGVFNPESNSIQIRDWKKYFPAHQGDFES